MEEPVCWYVLRAVFRRELAIRDSLRRAGFHCYVPMIYKIETVRGRKVRKLVPAITELVFVHASAEAISDFKLHSRETFYWLTRSKGLQREKIIVPDKAMNDFIRVTQQSEMSVTYFRPEELSLGKGDRIVIHGGPFDGVECTLMKVKSKRKRQMVVSIPGIAAVAVNVHPDMVEIAKKQHTSSCDSQSDARSLIQLSTQMLTAPPDRISQATEWDILHHEIRRLYLSLHPLRGYLPALEGEIALSLLMAEYALHAETEDIRNRFEKALSALGESTLLGVRMQFIGGVLLSDDGLLLQAKRTIALWQSSTPTDRQRIIIAETGLFNHRNID